MRQHTRFLTVLLLVWLGSIRLPVTVADDRDDASRPASATLPPITAVAVSPDRQLVVSGSQAGVMLHAWPALKPVQPLPVSMAHVHDLAFSPDGQWLAIAGGEPAEQGTLELWDWQRRIRVHRFTAHRDLIYSVAWPADVRQIVTASADRHVGRYDVVTGESLPLQEGHSRGVLAVSVLPDALGFVSGGMDGTIRLWPGEGNEPLRSFTNHTRAVTGLSVAPGTPAGSPPVLASISEDRTARFWQPTIGRMVRFVRLDAVPTALAWTADGSRLVVSCRDGHVRQIAWETAELVADQPVLDGIAYSLALTADHHAVVGGSSGQLRVVDLRGTP